MRLRKVDFMKKARKVVLVTGNARRSRPRRSRAFFENTGHHGVQRFAQAY